MIKTKTVFISFALFAYAASLPAYASNAGHNRSQHHGIKAKAVLAEIPPAFYRASAEKHVPADLLYAINLQESQLPTNMGRIVPWPWTVNWQGRGYRFKTRAEMYQFCQKLLAKGYRSFDIGSSQVNWLYHSDRFGNDLWKATDPMTNLLAAADYLYERYQVTGDWWQATGDYHNPNDAARASSYRKSVYQRWIKVKALLPQNKA